MPWPLSNKEEPPKPEEKKEKTPAELIAESLGTFTTEMKSKFDELGTRMTKIEESAIRKPDRTVENKEERPRTSFLDNEDQAFLERAAPIMVDNLNTKFEIMYDRVAREYVEDIGIDAWREVETDVRKSLEDQNVNPVIRANPQYIRNTVDMILGQKTRKGLRFNKNEKRFFLEDGANADPSTSPLPKPEDGLTERQVRAAKSFGVKLEDYKKSLGQLEIVN